MVRELHYCGFEKLRIIPYLSPSGLYWRCEFVPKKMISKHVGTETRQISINYDLPCYTSGSQYDFFGWEDGDKLTPAQMAERFRTQFPQLLEDCKGQDKEYAKWFFEMIITLSGKELPCFFSNASVSKNYVMTTLRKRFPMPPPNDED
jgi:hypothetical protein